MIVYRLNRVEVGRNEVAHTPRTHRKTRELEIVREAMENIEVAEKKCHATHVELRMQSN